MAKDVKDKSPAPRIETFADHAVITPHNSLKHAIRTTGSRGGAPDNDDPVARAESALAGLSSEFKSWMHAECDRLAAAHTAVIAKGFNTLTRGELFRAAHDIKGDAATFGFPSAGVAAESLCRIIEHAPDLDQVPAELITHHINAIQAIVRERTKLDTAATSPASEGNHPVYHVTKDNFIPTLLPNELEKIDNVVSQSGYAKRAEISVRNEVLGAKEDRPNVSPHFKERTPRQCDFCKKLSKDKDFQKCSRCKLVFYCGKEWRVFFFHDSHCPRTNLFDSSQRMGWPSHKHFCKQAAASS